MPNVSAPDPLTFPGTPPHWATSSVLDVQGDEPIAWTHYGPVHTAGGASVHLERVDLIEGRDGLEAGPVEVTIETNGWPVDYSLYAAAHLPDLIKRAIGDATLLEMLQSDTLALKEEIIP